MKYKIFPIILSLMLVLSGCKKDKEEQPIEETEVVYKYYDEYGEPVLDESTFNGKVYDFDFNYLGEFDGQGNLITELETQKEEEVIIEYYTIDGMLIEDANTFTGKVYNIEGTLLGELDGMGNLNSVNSTNELDTTKTYFDIYGNIIEDISNYIGEVYDEVGTFITSLNTDDATINTEASSSNDLVFRFKERGFDGADLVQSISGAIIRNSRVLIPIEYFHLFNDSVTIEYNDIRNYIEIQDKEDIYHIYIDSNVIYKNGLTKSIAEAKVTIDEENRPLIPLERMGKLFNFEVEYDENTKEIIVK